MLLNLHIGLNPTRGRLVKLSHHINVKTISLFLLATVAYSVFFQALYNMLHSNTLIPYPNFEFFLVSFIKNYVPILVLWVVNVCIIFWMPLPQWLERRIIPKTLIDLCVSLGALLAVDWLYLKIMTGLLVIPSEVHAAGTILSDILIVLFVEIAYYVCLSRELDLKAAELRTQAMNYRYEALKSQINPHFLFNSLNILYSLIDLDKAKSKTFTLALTSVYRHVLSFRNRTTVEVEEELELARAYLEVLSIRYHNQLFVDIRIESSEALRRMMIPFSLQLLLENVTKHNEVSSLYPMQVSIQVETDSLTITNTVRPRPAITSSGVGLHYIRQQYSRFKREVVTTEKEGRFAVTLPYL